MFLLYSFLLLYKNNFKWLYFKYLSIRGVYGLKPFRTRVLLYHTLHTEI